MRRAGVRHLLPVATEPVKLIASTCAWSSIVCPTTEPRPITRLNTPFGAPALTMISASAWAEPGTRSAGLNTTRIAEGERRRDLPGGNGDREIPRRDDADDADRLARHLDVDARPHGGEFLAGNAQGLAGEEIEDLRGAADFADRLGQRLAFLARQQPAEFFLAARDLE